MRKEFQCPDCDNFFVLTYKSGDPVEYCPFCSSPLCLDDCNEFDEEEEND